MVSKFNITDANNTVNTLVANNGLKIKSRTSDNSGAAFFDRNHNPTKELIIPQVTDELTFGTCLHEIGHIIEGIVTPHVHCEYLAEMQAIKLGQQYGFNMLEYGKDSMRHILISLLQSINHGLLFSNIPVNIIEYLKYSLSEDQIKNICGHYCKWHINYDTNTIAIWAMIDKHQFSKNDKSYVIRF